MAIWMLSACGGNTFSGSGSTTTTTGPTVAGISLLASSPQIASNNTGPATITAYAHDANNNTVPGATITFSASSGLLSVTQPKTDTSGAAIATLAAGSDPSDRIISVKATSGAATATLTVNVVGTVLSMTGPQALVEPGTGNYTVSLKNSAGVGIDGEQVTLSSANNNTLSATTVTTDVNGQATFTVTAANGGSDTLTATALGISATESITVSTQSFVFSAPAPNTKISLGASTPVTVTWTNGGAPVPGQTVTFAATRGTLGAGTAVTNASGVATVNISSTTSGPAVISATGSGVSAQQDVDFVATNPSAIAVQASPDTIDVNAQSTITAVVRDAHNNLVEGQTVTFSLTDITGGTLSLASALTNNQGEAQTIYTASSGTSATNGVTVTAAVQGTSVKGQTTLTVAGETVFMSFGTGNQVDVLNEAQYGMPFAILAVDSAGNPVHGVTIDLKVISVNYGKGNFTYPTGATVWKQNVNALCASEDLNNNGILDPGEDFNNNGKLDPGNVAVATPGSVVTSTTATSTVPEGAALFEIVYPKDHAYWVGIKLVATATVAGTESSAYTDFELVGAATDYDTATVSPPGVTSPYGVASSCANPN
jgi:hypothetical protein